MDLNKRKMELFAESTRNGINGGEMSAETRELLDQNKTISSSLSVADSIIQ
jgi:hypothetical protein